MLQPLLGHGILKERFSALATDAIRAKLLDVMGYKTQLLEFIDMEHTPKNILIRAVKSGGANVFGALEGVYGVPRFFKRRSLHGACLSRSAAGGGRGKIMKSSSRPGDVPDRAFLVLTGWVGGV
ncbi:hypothetical protein HMSSN139_52810 [Paenibacillus sp. HMSSN-139]|nr:hypothetical protein HMSSN139_52810 [Paenibacillus sp. HMSSN-139]